MSSPLDEQDAAELQAEMDRQWETEMWEHEPLPSPLAIVLGQHRHIYDSDCTEDFGCSCGAITDYDKENIDHADHVAQVLTEMGYHL